MVNCHLSDASIMQVMIYTTPTCGYCKMAKAFLKERNVSYEEKDVAADSNAAQFMIEKSGQMGVPFIVIVDDKGEEHTKVGFDEDWLKKTLGL